MFKVCTIAPNAGITLLSNGLRVVADFGIDNAPPCDLVIITGGPGWSAQAKSSATLDYVRKVYASSAIASVCTGSMILAASGILNDGAATTSAKLWSRSRRP